MLAQKPSDNSRPPVLLHRGFIGAGLIILAAIASQVPGMMERKKVELQSEPADNS